MLVLPWVIALALELLHRLNGNAVAILATVSFGLPAVWLAWVPIRNANRSGVGRSVSASAVRVSKADPRRLGVHAAISVRGVPDEVPPEYVPRDADAGIRAKVAVAAERGGFVLLVGGSSVGKTRSAFEAIRALLPDWWLVHPAGQGEVAALAAAPPSRTVVWLDELQSYLDGEHGLTGGVVRALLTAPHPAVIIGTLWPDRYAAYAAVPAPDGADPYAGEREVLKLTDVVRIATEFTQVEQDRARAAAARDPRLRVALEAAGYGLTQTLAAAPQLVARWEDAQAADPYGWAVLTAALDAARLGARAPLSAEFLRAAAPGYCTGQQQAEAPENWFAQALAYATAKLQGAVTALGPAGVSMGQVAGYTAADYLIQHASRERRSARVPASTWDAVLGYVRDPADTSRLAHSANKRLLYRYAIPLYRHAADVGDGWAAVSLAGLLARRGDLDELRARADAGDSAAASQLAEVLELRGDLEQAAQVLRALADAGDRDAAVDPGAMRDLHWHLPNDVWQRDAAGQLARLLYERGDLEGLRARAEAGDRDAPKWLAELLAVRRDLQGLRARAEAGDGDAASWLARLLAERGDLEGLRARADAGDRDAAARLARLLEERGDLEQAAQVLRALAEAGDRDAAARLARLLEERGDRDAAAQVVRAWAEAGDRDAAARLAGLLEERGDLEQAAQVVRALRAWADAGDRDAAMSLARTLEKGGDLEQAAQVLRARAEAGDGDAASWLARLLAERGDLEALRARAEAGDRTAAARLARLLAERGDLEALQARAEAGDGDAAWWLAELLARRGDLEALRARAEAGDRHASVRLPKVLREQGRHEEAEQLRRFGLDLDGSIARE